MARDQRVQAFVQEIRVFFSQHAEKKVVEKMSRYFKDGYEGYGVAYPVFKEARDRWISENEDMGLAGFLDVADELWQSPKYEEGGLAIQLVGHFKDELTPATFKRIVAWLDNHVHNWGHCDVLCGELLNHCVLSGIASRKELQSWAKAKQPFKRRALPVSLIALVKNDEPVAPLLEMTRPLMTDEERVVQQGTGWFLRECWKKDPKTTEKFLMEWKDEAPRLIIQYATEKMGAAQKKKFAKAKTAKA